MASRFIIPQADVGSGISPADGSKLFFFDTGTSNKRFTFSDEAATIKNANPVIADGDGVFPDIWLVGIYKVVLQDKKGVQTGFGEADPVNEMVNLKDSAFAKNFATLAAAVADVNIVIGDALNIAERTTGNGGGAMWDVVLSSGVTENTFNIVQATGVGTLSLVLRVDDGPISAATWGISPSVADNSPAIIDFISYLETNERSGHVPGGDYACDSSFNFNKDIKFSGDAGVTNFIFSLTSGYCIGVASSAATNGLILEDFNVEGPSAANVVSPTQTTIGLNLNPTVSQSCTRNVFRKLQFQKLHTAIETNVAFTNHFDTCLSSQCHLPLRLGSQTNNTLFTAFQSANSWLTMDVLTSEGVQFDSPLFQNVGATAGQGSQITLFQSHIVLINPYFENTAVDGVATVGTGAESSTVRSSLTIIGGEMNEGSGSNVIIIGQDKVHIHVEGIRSTESTGIFMGVPGSPSTVTSLKYLRGDSVWKPYGADTDRQVTSIEEMLPNNNKIFAKTGGGGGVLTVHPNRQGYRTMQTDTTFRGPLITQSLVSGEWYTIVYAIRRSATMGITIDHDDGATDRWATGLPADPLPSEDFEIRYMPFKSEGDTLSFLLSDTAEDIQIRYFAVFHGVGIPEINIGEQAIVWDIAAPSTGTWIQGDEAKNQSVSVGMPTAWRCDVAGTPGTWGVDSLFTLEATAAELNDVGDFINTGGGKTKGRKVLNTTEGLYVVAAGSSAASAWKFEGDGNGTSNTPA